MLDQQRKPSFRGLFFLILFLLICLLPLALFRVGYKFSFVSKELVLLLFVNLLVLVAATTKINQFKIQLPQILLLLAATPVFLLNWGSFHLLAVLGLYLLLLLLIPEIIPADRIFIWLAWSATIATLFSFYQQWSTAYGVVPAWLELATPTNRMSGVFGQANLFACLVVVGLFSWLQVLWQRFGQAGWRWYYQLPVTIFFWALLLTGSRAGMLAFLSALLLLGWGLSRTGERQLLKFFALQLLWSLSFGLLLFLLLQPPGIEFIGDRTINFTETSSSTGQRLIYWGSSLSMGFDHLWTGVGLGGYRRLLGSYMVPVAEWMRIPYDSIGATLWGHNDFLHIFAECGLVVLLLLLFVFGRTLYKLLPSRNPQALFCFCAIWAFFIFMQFEHPFNDHVLVFFLIFLTAGSLQFSPEKFSWQIPKKLATALLVPCLFFINFYIISHALDMYRLKSYLQSVSSSPLTVERLTTLQAEQRYDELVSDPLLGWEFQFTHLQALGNYTVQHADPQLAAYLIPEFLKFQSEHASSVLTYQLSRLYFLVGDYAVCKETADQAFALKPDMYHYSNFGHICLVFAISQREKIPVVQLLGKTYFDTLLENGVFKLNVLDAKLIAL
jgi:O-antigen ligase